MRRPRSPCPRLENTPAAALSAAPPWAAPPRASVLRACALWTSALVLAGCGGPTEVQLTLLGTTDVHGYLLPYDYATDRPREGSLAQVVSLVDSIRGADPHVLLFDSGDLLQGSALNSYRAALGSRRGETASPRPAGSPHPVIAAMNAAGYAASAVGNHEFNYGVPYLERTLADARFPFLAANIRRAGTDSTAFPPYAILRAGPLRVGVVGLTTPGVAIWDRANVEGRLEFDDLVESARRWLPPLREKSDLIVVVAHSGLGPGSSYAQETGVPEENAVARLAHELPEIAVIFGGHAHVRIAGRRVGPTLVLEAGRFADVLAVAHLTLRKEGGRWRVTESVGELLSSGDAPPAEAIVRAVRADHERTLAWLREPIGYTPDRWSAAKARFEDTPIADLITRVEQQVSGAELASTAIFDPGAAFGPGPITRRHILGLYIYPNTLKVVRISGADLQVYLDRSARYYRTWSDGPLVNDSVPGYNFDVLSGAEYALDLRRPAGHRVIGLRRAGRAVLPTDSFTLALNNYRQSGGGGFQRVAGAPVVFSAEREIADLIIDFVRARDTLRIADVHRRNWRLLPDEAASRLGREAAAAGRH